MKLYVYCLLVGLDELPHSLHGIGGAVIRLWKWEQLLLLVSEFAGEVVPVTRENVLAHAAVVQNVLEWTTPLPFRFGALVTEEQLRSYVRSKQELLPPKLEQVRGCVEMSVKIIWDCDWTEEPATNVSDQKPGTAFLAEKRREILGGETRAQEAKRIAEWLEDQIRDVVRQIDLRGNDSSKLLVSAACLVERERLAAFRARVGEIRKLRPELHFLVSGPWAPYSFAYTDLEFKTHFGVS